MNSVRNIIVVLLCILFPMSSYAECISEDSEYGQRSECEASVIDILVYANSAVDDLCNQFNGSWVDTALTVYCSFGGDIYTCTAYKIVQAACTVNGAVRLVIEGDTSAALKKILVGSTKVYSVSKIADKFYIKE